MNNPLNKWLQHVGKTVVFYIDEPEDKLVYAQTLTAKITRVAALDTSARLYFEPFSLEAEDEDVTFINHIDVYSDNLLVAGAKICDGSFDKVESYASLSGKVVDLY